MKKIRCIFNLETGHNLSRVFIGILFAFTLGAVIVFQDGLDKFRIRKASQDTFVKNEQRRIDQYSNFFQYAQVGFSMTTSPSNIVSLFHNSTSLSELNSFFDARFRLNFNKPQSGGPVFDKPTGAVLDFSWYLLVIGSLLTLCWAFFTFKNVAYMRFLMSFADSRSVFWGVMLSRVLLLTVSLAFIFLVLGLQLVVNGLIPGKGEIEGILLFFLVAETTLLFVLLIGARLGMLKNSLKGGIMAAIFWLTLFLLWPEVLNSIFSGSANRVMKPLFANEIQKMDILIEFEKASGEKLKAQGAAADSIALRRQLMEEYWNKDYKKIEQLEKETIGNIKDLAARFHLWSIFNPATFYKSVNNEISSRGYNGYIGFYEYAVKVQKGFVRYYIDKRFYENDPQVKPFLKDEEYVFQLKSSLPHYFGIGLLVNLLYIVVALGFTYFGFMGMVFRKPQKAEAFEDVILKLKRGKFLSFSSKVDNDDFLNQVFNACWRKLPRDFKGKITLDGKEISPEEKVIYLPDHKRIPGDIKIMDLSLMAAALSGMDEEKVSKLKNGLKEMGIHDKHLRDLLPADKAQVMLTLAQIKGGTIYLLDDFIDRLSAADSSSSLKSLVDLKKGGALVIEIVYGDILHKPYDLLTFIFFEDSKYYIDILEKDKKQKNGK